MAIAYDSASTQFSASGGTATASGSFTCGSGSNRIMFISVANFSGADDITACTYNGVSATLVAKKGFNTLASPSNYAYLYYLVAPATGSNTLSVTRTNTTSTMFIACTTYTGASQTGIPDASTTGGTDDAATVSTSVTSTVDNCWTVIAAGSQRNITASSGVTVRAGSGTNQVIGDRGIVVYPAASSSIVLALSGASSRLTGTIMASFAPADTVLTVYAGSNDDYENMGASSVYYRAQGFKIPSNATVTGAMIYGSAGSAASGTFYLAIYSGADPGTTQLTEQVFTTTSALSAYGSPAWNALNFGTPVDLTAGTQYYLRISPGTGSATDEVRWSKDTTSPSYADGASWTIPVVTWIEDTGKDENFGVLGTASASGPTNLKSLNTNVKANIKSYNTNVIANVKSINTNS